jgi:hypothetical protein
MNSKKKQNTSRPRKTNSVLRHSVSLKLTGYDVNTLVVVIGERMQSLLEALKPLGLKERTQMEIAFAIAEISPELEKMLLIIEMARKGETLKRADLVTFQGMAHHWSIHLADLKRYLLRAFDELEEPGQSYSSPITGNSHLPPLSIHPLSRKALTKAAPRQEDVSPTGYFRMKRKRRKLP